MSLGCYNSWGSPRSERTEDLGGFVLLICLPSCPLVLRCRITSSNRKHKSVAFFPLERGEATLCPLFRVLSLCLMLPELGRKGDIEVWQNPAAGSYVALSQVGPGPLSALGGAGSRKG